MFARAVSSRYVSGRFQAAHRKPSLQSSAIGTGSASAPPSSSATVASGGKRPSSMTAISGR